MPSFQWHPSNIQKRKETQQLMIVSKCCLHKQGTLSSSDGQNEQVETLPSGSRTVGHNAVPKELAACTARAKGKKGRKRKMVTKDRDSPAAGRERV